MTELVLSRETIKRLIQSEGYYRYNRDCPEPTDKSIQTEFNLTSDEVKTVFDDPQLKGLKRKIKRTILFAEDQTDIDTQSEDDNLPSMDNLDNEVEVSAEIPQEDHEDFDPMDNTDVIFDTEDDTDNVEEDYEEEEEEEEYMSVTSFLG